jgi:hypothetical protein
MITVAFAREVIQFLWQNRHILSQHVDLHAMPPERLDALVEKKALVRPFRVATALARQGYFISAWSLWEFYARSLCEGLPVRVPPMPHQSTVAWVNRSLVANGRTFRDFDWFLGANGLRNLLTHYCGLAVGARAERHLAQARRVFPNLELFQDRYVCLEHEHVAELQVRIEEFLNVTG